MTHIIHTPHEVAITPVADTCDWLEVRRGMTQFPRRPLVSNRFLIGSGTNCHLQLGGGMPMLHSLLTREQEGWVAEAIAPEPMLFVNDHECRRQVLCVDDVIRIGTIEFVLRSTPDRERGWDSSDEDGYRDPVALDDVSYALDHANTDAFVVNQSSSPPLNHLEINRVPLLHPVRRASHRYDAALRLLASPEADENSHDARSEDATNGQRNRVA